jgi:hypothetical protein
MPLPVPALDHVVINVRDGLDAAAELYGRLGFTLTPRGHHTLGSSNNLAVLGTDYLELLGVQPGGGSRADVLDWPAGLNGVVFKTFDSDAMYAALQAAGLPVLPPQAFSRPVNMPDGATGDAAFRTVRLERQAAPAGRLFFCHHLTPQLVWHDAWRRHANGALGLQRAVIAAEDPAEPAALLTRLFGEDAVQQDGDGFSLLAGLARINIVTPAALAAEFGAAAPDAAGRGQFMAALTLRTASLDRADAALQAGGVAAVRERGRLVVPARTLDGMTLVFVQ